MRIQRRPNYSIPNYPAWHPSLFMRLVNPHSLPYFQAFTGTKTEARARMIGGGASGNPDCSHDPTANRLTCIAANTRILPSCGIY